MNWKKIISCLILVSLIFTYIGVYSVEAVGDYVPENVKVYVATALLAGGAVYKTVEGVQGAVNETWKRMSNTAKNNIKRIATFGLTTFTMTNDLWSSVQEFQNDCLSGNIDNLEYEGIGKNTLFSGDWQTVSSWTSKRYYLPLSTYTGTYQFLCNDMRSPIAGKMAIYTTTTYDKQIVFSKEYRTEKIDNKVWYVRWMQVKYLDQIWKSEESMVESSSEGTPDPLNIDYKLMLTVGEGGLSVSVNGEQAITLPDVKSVNGCFGYGGMAVDVSAYQMGSLSVPIAGNLTWDGTIAGNPSYDPTGRKFAVPPGALDSLDNMVEGGSASQAPGATLESPVGGVDSETGTVQGWLSQVWTALQNLLESIRALPASIAGAITAIFTPTLTFADVFADVKEATIQKLGPGAIPSGFVDALQDKGPPKWYIGQYLLIDWADYESLMGKIRMWCGSIMIALTAVWCFRAFNPKQVIS